MSTCNSSCFYSVAFRFEWTDGFKALATLQNQGGHYLCVATGHTEQPNHYQHYT